MHFANNFNEFRVTDQAAPAEVEIAGENKIDGIILKFEYFIEELL
jgi:hypothetical protein